MIKRDGHRQPFDREKLLGSLNRATHKREVDPRKLGLLVDGSSARSATPAAS